MTRPQPIENKRVADKGELVRREKIRDVAGGMARRFDDARLDAADLHRVALAHRFIDMGDALRFARAAPPPGICDGP